MQPTVNTAADFGVMFLREVELVLIDYEKPEQYFVGDPASVSTIMCGKTKRKLSPITISIWKTIHKDELAEIDGSAREIPYSYIGLEISGEKVHKNVIEGFSDFEAMNCVVSCIYSVLAEFLEETGCNLYINNYAGQEWCKVDLEEMFYGLSKSF